MNIAVTGATGHLGRTVIGELIGRVSASNVIALARDVAKADDLAARGVAVRAFDYDADAESLRSALDGVDRLLLISGTSAHRRTQHANVINAAKAAGVALIAYTSVLQADTAINPVAPDHVATEALLAASGLDTVLLRNGWYNENFIGDARHALETGTLVTSAGDGRVASAARADYAAAAAAVLADDGHAGRTYELSGDVAWSRTDLAADLTALAGRTITVTNLSPDALTASGAPAFVVAVDRATAAGDLAQTTGELSRLIGRPTTPIAETLRAALVVR